MNTEPNLGYCVKHGAYRLDIGCLMCMRQNTPPLAHNNTTNRGQGAKAPQTLQYKHKRFKVKR